MYSKIKGMVLIKGLTMGEFYERTGFNPATLTRRCASGKLTVRDAKVIQEALHLNREETMSLFFER